VTESFVVLQCQSRRPHPPHLYPPGTQGGVLHGRCPGVAVVEEQLPQRQDSLTDQLRDVVTAAVRMGCYDAADCINRWLDEDAAFPVGAKVEHRLASADGIAITGEVTDHVVHYGGDRRVEVRWSTGRTGHVRPERLKIVDSFAEANDTDERGTIAEHVQRSSVNFD
jgi:hypothetical protein